MNKLAINMNMNSIQCAMIPEPEEMFFLFFFYTDLELETLLEEQKQSAQKNNQRSLRASQSRCQSSHVEKIRSPPRIPRRLRVKPLLSNWTSSEGNVGASAAGEVPLDSSVAAQGITSVTLCMIGLAF